VKALILAAGLGTRLLPFTFDRPKPMLPVGGRPLLEHTLGLLRAHGVRQIAINLHHHAEVIAQYFGDGSSLALMLVYSREDRLLGTAGAAKKLEAFLDEPFYVIYGDVLTDVDLSRLAAWHRDHGAALSLALYRVEDPSRAGIVEVDASGRVRRFVEKPPPSEVFSELASTGILVAEPEILRGVPRDTFCDFGQHLIPWLLERQEPVYGCLADGYVLDIGSPERYQQAQADAEAGHVRLERLRRRPESSTSHNPGPPLAQSPC
jgi:mannose-1-phosphate guanylyltransferase